MIRYYTVEGDLKNGFDFDYTFYHYKDAEEKYNQVTGVPFKCLNAFDDEKGEIIIKSQTYK